MTIGDAGSPNSDASYTGDTGDSSFSMQYYRNKIAEFQDVMQSLDAAAQAATGALAAAQRDGNDSELISDLSAMLDEYSAKKFTFRATAEAINAGAAAINWAGGRVPELSIPAGLGAAPLVIGGALVAAIAVAVTLISWARQWMAGVQHRISVAAAADLIEDPQAKAEFLANAEALDAAAAAAEESPLASLASILKWGAIAFIAITAYREFAQD